MAKQKVSGTGGGKINWQPIITVGLLVAAYKIVGQPILEALNLIDTSDEKAAKAALQDTVSQHAAELAKTQTPTKSDAEWLMITNTIYEDLKYSSIADNKDDAAYQLARARNDADVFKMVEFFGTRQNYWFGIPWGEKQSLQTFVRANLSDEKIAAVNDNYLRKGIQFKF